MKKMASIKRITRMTGIKKGIKMNQVVNNHIGSKWYLEDIILLDIDSLGDYYIEHKLGETEGKTFQQFIREYKKGREVDLTEKEV